MRNKAPAPRGDRSGFALLITVTLLAFLVLLLVSLSTLTRVETQVASNNQHLSQARQNALMALNIALGRLQETAGPDTRVTGTADLIAGRNIDKKNWTGVWNAAAAGSDKNIAWLVSGTAPAGSSGVASALTAASGNSLVPLVGINSSDTTIEGNEVVVETQAITTTDIPGLDASTPEVIGNYAYWIGDEGVKAKGSLTDPWQDARTGDPVLRSTEVGETDADTFSFFGVQRMGIEGMSSTGANTALTDKIGAAYPASADEDFRRALPNVLSLHQLPLASTPASPVLATSIKNRFHDLTASSYSLLTDVSAGGLKRDLTAWLRRPGDAPAASDLIPLPEAYSAYPASERLYLPKWGLIRSYADYVADVAVKDAQTQSDDRQGLFPVATYSRLGLSVSCAGDNQPLKLHLFPHLILWNPTNVRIGGSFDYCIGFPFNPQAAFRLSNAPDSSVTAKLRVYLGAASLTGPTAVNSSLPFQYFRFRIQLPVTGIEPGQSLAFTLSSSAPYAAGTNLMEPHDPIRKDNSVTIDGASMTAADRAKNVYCYLNSGNMDMLLCPPFDNTSPPPTPAELVASAYQIGRIGEGYGLPFVESLNSSSNYIPMGPAADLTLAIEPVLNYQLLLHFSQLRRYAGESPRWLANLNPRAGLMLRKRSYFGNTTATPNTEPPAVEGNRNSAGDGSDPRVINSAPVDALLFEFLPAGVPLFSIAQLQHAGLSLTNLNPAYAVGNSLADYYVDRGLTSYAFTAAERVDNADSLLRTYDLSYLLNQALWDKYFFSTVPASLTSADQLDEDYRLPNSRHEFHWRADATAEFNELRTTDTAAAHLLLNGGFNINSTSVQAWRALLYSHNRPAAPSAPDDKHPFSRFVRPAGTPNSTWTGHRVLTDAQLDNLAANIVKQVKARGPFLSLAAFVNRSLVDLPGTPEDERLKGPLQAALDATDDVIADDNAPYANNVNQRAPFTPTGTPYRISSSPYPDNSYPGGLSVDRQEKYRGGVDAAGPFATMAAFAPGFLTQADLLNALGPVITARSDTFLIRAYGDVQNPVDRTVTGKAWCEAVVQRLPDYVDDSGMNPWTTPATGSPNATFGRRFKVVSFRWLAASDI